MQLTNDMCVELLHPYNRFFRENYISLIALLEHFVNFIFAIW